MHSQQNPNNVHMSEKHMQKPRRGLHPIKPQRSIVISVNSGKVYSEKWLCVTMRIRIESSTKNYFSQNWQNAPQKQ